MSRKVNANNVLPKEEQGLTEELEKLLDVVSMCRDINNDFRNQQFKKELEEIENKALEVFKQQLLQQENRGKINLTIIGNFSSGKSSIINALLGSDVCAVKVNPTTSSITRFVYGEEERIFQITPDGKKKEISKDKYLKDSQHKVNNMEKTKVTFFEYHYPSPLLENITLYDTPGFENPKNKNDEIVTETVFKQKADAVLFVQDISKPSLEETTKERIEKLKKEKPDIPWILILNKADIASEKDINTVLNFWKENNNGLFDEIIVYSAKTVRDLQAIEKSQREVENRLINTILEKKKALISIRENGEATKKKKSLFKKKKENLTKSQKLEIELKTDEETELLEYQTVREKEKKLFEAHKKLLETFKELSIQKDELLEHRIQKLKKALVKVADENLKKVKATPEEFEPIEELKKAIKFLTSIHEEAYLTAIKNPRADLTAIVKDVLDYLKQKRELLNLDPSLIEKAVKEAHSNAGNKLEAIRNFFTPLINHLEGQLKSREARGQEQARRTGEKLQKLKEIIRAIEKDTKSNKRKISKRHNSLVRFLEEKKQLALEEAKLIDYAYMSRLIPTPLSKRKELLEKVANEIRVERKGEIAEKHLEEALNYALHISSTLNSYFLSKNVNDFFNYLLKNAVK